MGIMAYSIIMGNAGFISSTVVTSAAMLREIVGSLRLLFEGFPYYYRLPSEFRVSEFVCFFGLFGVSGC